MRKQKCNGYRASKPMSTVWTFHMPTCDHHDTDTPLWFVMTIIYFMSYTTWRLFRQVSCPSAKWRVFCLPTANTHTHTHTRPPTPYFYRKLKFIGRY